MHTTITLSSVIEAIHAADAKRAKQLAENIAAAGMEPTRDRAGRLHAPCNGYVWCGSEYAAGEFLADEFGEMGGARDLKPVKIDRFMATSEAAAQLKALNIGFTSGSAFERDGHAVCYVYGEMWSGHATAVKSAVPASRKILSLAGQANGTTWATTAGKLHGKIYPLACAPTYSLECMEDVAPELDEILGEWFSHKMKTGKSKRIPLEIGYNHQTFVVA